MKNIHNNARQRAKKKGLEFDLSFSELVGMLELQGGKCAYSGVSMEVEQPNSHWRMSLERVDNHMGYTTSNCVLVAAEFNSCDFSRARNVDPESVLGTAQWSLRKVQEVSRLRSQSVSFNELVIDIEDARGSANQLGRPKTSRGSIATHYDMRFTYGYKTTKRLKRSFLRGHLQTCLGNARQRAKLREQDCCITVDFLLDLLEWQGGLCYYSRVPLQYKQVHTDWRLSIERLDNSIGYTPDNCVLIAVEFNTPDHSRNVAVTEVFGTAQWSREKVWHVWGF